MPSFLTDRAFLLIAGIAAIWFFMRFIVGPRRGAPRLADMFARERPTVTTGMGTEAIATLIADTKSFVSSRADTRGLILAGPFAAAAGVAGSTVTFVVISDDPAAFAGPGWIDGWSYPARSHPILTREEALEGGAITQRLALRGSPPLVFHFVKIDVLDPPDSLRPALAAGTMTLDDPTGIAGKLRRHWTDMAGRNWGEKP